MSSVAITVLSAFFTLILVGIVFLMKKNMHEKITTYKQRHVNLVSRLDLLTRKVNFLNSNIYTVRNNQVLDYFESTLRIIDTLLTTMKKISPQGNDASLLNSAIYLVKDCDSRVERIKEAFELCKKGKKPDLDKLYNAVKEIKNQGCYFCSRPVQEENFTKTKVKLDGKTLKVLSCEICKEELKANKKVKVLHLIKDGKTLHWSEVSDYVASENYWKLNDSNANKTATKLTLIVSRREPLDSKNSEKND